MLEPEARELTQAEFDDKLIEDMGRFFYDPLGWVKYAYHWGEGDLLHWEGPDEWQTAWLTKLGEGLRKGMELSAAIADAQKLDPNVMDASSSVRMATTSGHGVGKSATVAWVIGFCMSTRPNLVGVEIGRAHV